jgi:hypothetical protein
MINAYQGKKTSNFSEKMNCSVGRRTMNIMNFPVFVFIGFEMLSVSVQIDELSFSASFFYISM